jgi:predicted transcriptional regulator
MSNVKITVGGAMEKEAARRFIDAWHRAESGETFPERRLAFESWDTLARVLTGKRMELLRYVRRHISPAFAPSLRRCAATNVHADVQALTAAGLLEATDGGVRADYDANQDSDLKLASFRRSRQPLADGAASDGERPPAAGGSPGEHRRYQCACQRLFSSWVSPRCRPPPKRHPRLCPRPIRGAQKIEHRTLASTTAVDGNAE